ncbi:helix-turn-helix transcriptional regulator [Marinobacter bohaiensis]|uniref:helix-turn-helix transcriptional regulator n=1 Tax=Marinobacter bohaiensis TaxID=2201898 RepID=UPI000DAD13F2|nr:helix-turn-helix transcriptional regulator [Marinobacter bohaiensis]
MQPASSIGLTRSFRIRDFLDFGQQYGMDYRFHDLPPEADNDEAAVGEMVVARGRIHEVALPSGFRFTGSELDVFQTYSSLSRGHAPLLIVIVLEGRVGLSVGAVSRELCAGDALSLQLRPEFALEATQRAGQRLKTLTLAFDPACLLQAGPDSSTLTSIFKGIRKPVLTWSVPSALLMQLDHCLDVQGVELQRNLILEGLALQVVGQGLPEADSVGQANHSANAREYQRLEAVRQTLEFAPTRDYTLESLAQQAAMSASSLRSKFRSTFGVSVFDYLRRCRLELGRRYLEQGFSVQQAAHRAGYRHATNFATAFRREYGVSPKALR